VAQVILPADGSYIVTAATEVGNASGKAGFVDCSILQANNPIAGGSAEFTSENVFGRTITLTAAATGGVVKLSCNPDNAANVRNTVITAVKVGTLHTQ
jgi:hypothetical protein